MQEPDADDMGGAPDNDADDMGQGMLDPETVGYHDDARSCGNCKHNQEGNCDVIGQQVSDEGGCRVWEGGMEQGAQPGPETGSMNQNMPGQTAPPMDRGSMPGRRW